MPSFPQGSPRSLQLCLEAEVCCQRLSKTLGTAQHMSYLLHQTWFHMARESHHILQGKDAFAFPTSTAVRAALGRKNLLHVTSAHSAFLPFCTVRSATCRQCMGCPSLPHSTNPLRTEVVPGKGHCMKSLLSSKPAACLVGGLKGDGIQGSFSVGLLWMCQSGIYKLQSLTRNISYSAFY